VGGKIISAKGEGKITLDVGKRMLEKGSSVLKEMGREKR